MLSDSDGTVAQSYGVVLDELEGHRTVPRSSLFVVDPDRAVQYAWRSESPADNPDLDAVGKATNCHGDSCAIPEDKSYMQ